MSAPPAAVLLAIAAVSETVPCLEDCYSTIAVSYSAARDEIILRHPNPACDCVAHPDGPGAASLGAFVLEELSRFVAMAQYGEPLPVHVGGA